MRHPTLLTVALAGGLALTACSTPDSEVDAAMQDIEALQLGGEENLGELMLTVGDPGEAVNYFTRAARENPDRIDLQRGLATSLIRAGRPVEGAAAWTQVVAHPQATDADRIEHAGSLIRNNRWDEARTALDAIPPTVESYDRYRYEAMVADAREDWPRADSFYETAMGLTTTPASILNNWGYSNLTRGNFTEAERLFGEALRHDPQMYTAKNNLVLARGAQGNYVLPVIPMTQTERAQLLHTLALAAIRQSDVNIGRALLQEAVDTHPQHFEAASRALAALENNVSN